MRTKTWQPHLSTASDARAVRTRAALRQALLKLLKRKALDQITIRDIAATARIGYTTVLRHHPTKESVLKDLAAEEIRQLVDLTLPMMDANRAAAASNALFEYVNQRRLLWSTFLTGGAAGALREELLKIALGIAAERSRPAEWPQAEISTRLIVGGTVEMLVWWLGQREPMPIADAGAFYLRTVVLPATTSPPLRALAKHSQRRR